MEKITALYCRFAYDDKPEIIEEQKLHLWQYAQQHDFANPTFYIDSGVSGLIMDRPAFNELMADMEEGKIGAVIASDASRICRRSSVSTEYIEEIFPSYGVTFYAADEGGEKSLMDVFLSAKTNS